MSKRNEFIGGLLYAVQEIIIAHGADTIAIDVIKASGYHKNTFLEALAEIP